MAISSVKIGESEFAIKDAVARQTLEEIVPNNASSSNKLATAEDIPTKTSDLLNDSNFRSIFTGTQAEWDAVVDKSVYELVNLTDDGETGETVDAVTDGDMRPVTSNAVYDEVNSIKERLVITIPANTYATYSEALGAIKVVYDTLTDAEKRNAYICTNDLRIYNNLTTRGYFVTVNTWSADNKMALYAMYLPNQTAVDFFITGTDGVSVTDQSDKPQTAKMDLYVRAH